MDTVWEFHAEVPQATAREGLAQGSYMVARAGFKPTTHRTKGDESTNDPVCPMLTVILSFCCNTITLHLNTYALTFAIHPCELSLCDSSDSCSERTSCHKWYIHTVSPLYVLAHGSSSIVAC